MYTISPDSALDALRPDESPELVILMEVNGSAWLVVVGVVGMEPVDVKRLKPLTPVAAVGVVAEGDETLGNCV